MNNVVAIVITVLLSILLGYLVGALNFSIIIGKYFLKKDPRDFHSKNAGATNSSRIFGKKIGLLILVCDVFKTIIITIVVWMITKYCLGQYFIFTKYFNPYSLIHLTPLFALIGHCYPIYYKFKGGKGASTYGAFLWMISPFIAIVSFIMWISIIKYKKMISLSCVLTSVFCITFLFIPGLNWLYMLDFPITSLTYIDYSGVILIPTFIIQVVASITLIFKHKENILNIINKKERNISTIK